MYNKSNVPADGESLKMSIFVDRIQRLEHCEHLTIEQSGPIVGYFKRLYLVIML